MALYTLAAREQKTPYITNSVYSTALIVLLAVSLAAIGRLSGYTVLSTAGTGILALGIVSVFLQVVQTRNRRLNLRDDNYFKNLLFYRRCKRLWQRWRSRPTYEHDPMGFPPELLEGIARCHQIPSKLIDAVGTKTHMGASSLSLSCLVDTLSVADEFLTELSMCFLANNCWVQYTSCARHPIGLVMQLKKRWGLTEKSDWKQVIDHLIVVDAYTPHFGFSDSIHEVATDTLRQQGISCIRSKASYAGMHTAAARAFNTIKKRSKNPTGTALRMPTLVIYEGPHALVELESVEQYRIFVRHLVPSEQLWGGMFTVVLESALADHDLAVLQLYTDAFVHLKDGVVK